MVPEGQAVSVVIIQRETSVCNRHTEAAVCLVSGEVRVNVSTFRVLYKITSIVFKYIISVGNSYTSHEIIVHAEINTGNLYNFLKFMYNV